MRLVHIIMGGKPRISGGKNSTPQGMDNRDCYFNTSLRWDSNRHSKQCSQREKLAQCSIHLATETAKKMELVP